MKPVRTLWRAALVALLVVVAVAPLRRGLFGLPDTLQVLMPPPPRTLADAERIGTAWAWEALAEGLAPDSPDRVHAYERSLALDPTDEVTLVRRAACALQKNGPMAARAVPAAQAMVAAHQDNAYGHYLLAAALLREGDKDGCVRELRLGNLAPRYAPGNRETMERRAQLEARCGGRPGELGVPAWSSRFELETMREMSRQLAAAGDARTALELARFGGRVRDEGDLVIDALVGIALQSVAFRGPAAAERPRSMAGLTEEQRRQESERRLQDLARGFQARLRAAGLGEYAGWVDRETAKSAAVRRAALDASRSMWPFVGPLGGTMAWGLWAMLMAFTAGFLVVSVMPGRLRRVEPLPWRGPDLALLWAATLVPALAVTALLLRLQFARMVGGSKGSDLAHLALVAMPLVMVLALRGGLTWLGRRFARRVGDPQAARAYVRRSWQPVGAATAAVLLLLALAASGPLAVHRQRLLGSSVFDHEKAALDAARTGLPRVRTR